MTKQATTAEELAHVQEARWQGFKQLAKRLDNRQILAVELFRTPKDGTVAVFTVVRDGEPVKFVVTADSRGRVSPKASQPLQVDVGKQGLGVVHMAEASAALAASARLEGEPADPSQVAVGRPPPEEPTRPGVIAMAESMLSSAFNVGEFVDIS